MVVDVNWRPTFWGLAVDAMPTESIRVGMDELLAQAQLLKLAAEEAQALFGSQDPSVVAAMLPQKPGVVITDGAAGVSWALGPVAGSMPSYPVAVVDTTGAGDAFLAGLLHRLCQEPELLGGASEQRVQAALAFASACGALVCHGAGAIAPQPVEADVFDFIGSHSGG